LKLNKPKLLASALPGLLFFILAFARPGTAGAADFGLALSQEAKASGQAGAAALSYIPVLSPWVQGPLGGELSFYLSGRVGFEYAAEIAESGLRRSRWRDPVALPELDRTELTWLPSPGLYLRLGRHRYQDPSGFAASGLFDGLSAGFSAGGSRFLAGAWYTGLLYKDTADVVMTSRDRDEYEKPFSLDGTYFASRRLLAAFEWENPAPGPRSSFALAILAQFDLNMDGDWFHSQYLSARYKFQVLDGLDLEGAGAVALGQAPERLAVFFAGALGLRWSVPGALDDTLSLRGLYSSPSHNQHLTAFVPVSSLPQGQVFSPSLGGLSIIRGGYTLRLLAVLSLTAECSYFIRTDTVSFQDNREPDNLKDEGYFLGGECYAALRWMPLPDLALSAGGGAFFPGLGNAFRSGTSIRWKAVLGIIVSL
jgi:hypothetical protein